MLSLEELVQQPGRDLCTWLHPTRPDRIWFSIDPKMKITKEIGQIFKTQLDKVYKKPSHIPLAEIEKWLRTFAQRFTWEPELTDDVREGFTRQVRSSYNTQKAEWKKKYDADETNIPIDMDPSVWVGLGIFWSNSATKSLSETNRKNRLSTRNGKGISTQNGGPKSTETREREITIANNGVVPDYGFMLRDTHTNRVTKRVQDKVAEDILATIEADCLTQRNQLSQDGSNVEDLSRDDVNRIVINHVPKKKGRYFGVGRLPNRDLAASSSSSYYPTHLVNEVANLKEQLNEERELREKDRELREKEREQQEKEREQRREQQEKEREQQREQQEKEREQREKTDKENEESRQKLARVMAYLEATNPGVKI